MEFIIFLFSSLSFNFNPSYSLVNADLFQQSYYSTPKLSTLPITYLYTSSDSDKVSNKPPELGIYFLEGGGATVGGIIPLFVGVLLLRLWTNTSSPVASNICFFSMLASIPLIPLGAVYGVKKVGEHYQQKGSGWGALIGALIGIGLIAGTTVVPALENPCSPSPFPPAIQYISLLALPIGTVIGYNSQ
ncbi:MAG: hypothetical protein WC614_08005 [bacterium]